MSNAAGLFANQNGYVTDQFFDTNLLVYTTNYFQLFDVLLTNGINIVTIHATDEVGNTAATNFEVTLDYSSNTNPPILNIVWPANGTLISGTNFTLHAHVDDALDSVTATIVDSSGDTNAMTVPAQRNGNAWAGGLPLAAGTNILTVTAINPAGLSTTTNLTVVQSAVTVTMDPLPSDQLNQTSVNVTGTISETNYTLTVNGVPANINPTNGTWSAESVPASAVGMAVFDLEIFVGDPTNVGSQQPSVPQSPIVRIYHYAYDSYSWDNWHLISAWIFHNDGSSNYVTQDCWQPDTDREWWFWTDGQGGQSGEAALTPDLCSDSPVFSGKTAELSAGEYSYLVGFWGWANYSSSGSGIYEGEPYSESDSQQTVVTMDTGGEGEPGTLQLYMIEAEAFDDYYTRTADPLPPDSMTILRKTLQDTGIPDDNGGDWGCALFQLPPGTTNLNVTPKCADPGYYFNVLATNVTLQIIDLNNTNNVLSGLTNTVIVGQQMNLGVQLNVTNALLQNSMLTNFQWTVPGYAISNYVVAPDSSSAMLYTNFPTTNSAAVFYWVDGASNRKVQCSATIDGITISNLAVFSVLSPTSSVTATTGDVTLTTAWGDGLELSYGIPTVYGIVLSNSMTIPPGFSGTNQWVQVINSTSRIAQTNDGSGTLYALLATNVLDGSYPYPKLTPNSTRDAPGQGLFSQWKTITIVDNFSTRLMFKPAGGGWVPLNIVNWTWGGLASQTNGVWSLNSNTNAADSRETASFPLWTNNIVNFGFQKQ